MRMKKFSKFFMSMLAMCTIAACSNDELGNEPVVDPGASTDAVYMNVTVQLPTEPGTRSNTKPEGGSSDGTEVGKNYENSVRSVLLVLTQKDDSNADNNNKIIAHGVSSGTDLSVANSIVSSVHKITKTSLSNYYTAYGTNGTLSSGKENINVYVFCNPTSALIDLFEAGNLDNKWVDKIATIVEGATGTASGDDIWGGANHQNGFLMSTASDASISKKIPNKLEEWDNHTDADNAFDLSGNDSGVNNGGPIKVERSVARFDFKDGSKAETAANTYEVVKSEDKTKTLIEIELTKMALVNMSKQFYYLRRVSDDGLSSGTNYKLCGTETDKNYVVDTDAEAKQAASLDNFNYQDHFNFCLGTTTGTEWTIDENTRNQWYTTEISSVTSGEEDRDETWNSDDKHNTTKDGYHIWRYVTENTIPKPLDGKVAQRNGISTGIVFKGKMKATEAASDKMQAAINDATGNSADDAILYAYGNNENSKLFVRWTEVRDYAIDNKSTNLAFYNVVFGKTDKKEPKKGSGDGYTGAEYSDDKDSPDYLWNQWYNHPGKEEKDNEDLKKFKETVTKTAKFTLYQSARDDDNPSKGCYYCYYYYWNRHNNNGKPSEMGPMEFAVVRNNVYKLAVTEISKLGHPRISDNDPDPVDPEDPDESGDVYIKLSVEVLPWVVRINDIEF